MQTPSRNYTNTRQQFVELLRDSGIDPSLYHHVIEANAQATGRDSFPAGTPGVDTFCIYGTNVDTAQTLVYSSPGDFPDKQPKVLSTAGDGTVASASLSVCSQWPDTTHVKELPGVDHSGVLTSKSGISAVVAAVFA